MLRYHNSIKDFSITELSELRSIIDDLPDEFSYKINIGGKEYDWLDDLIEDREKELFNITPEDYKKIVGNVYINKKKDIILKVVGFNEYTYKDDPYYTNFFYIEYWKDNNDNWHPQDSYLLKNQIQRFHEDDQTIFYREHYSDLPPETSVNLCSEHMYMLGIDGNLYVDYSCNSDWECFEKMKDDRLFKCIEAMV